MALCQAAVQRFNIPPERRGVPTLIIGDNVLVGSREIPEQLPDLIARYLATGGVDYPPLPGLGHAVGVEMCGNTPCEESTTPAQAGMPGGRNVAEGGTAPDVVANALAGVVLAALAAALLYAFIALGKANQRVVARTEESSRHSRRAHSTADPYANWWSALIPVFALIGLGVASYLAYGSWCTPMPYVVWWGIAIVYLVPHLSGVHGNHLVAGPLRAAEPSRGSPVPSTWHLGDHVWANV